MKNLPGTVSAEAFLPCRSSGTAFNSDANGIARHVRRAGTPERVEFGSTQGGERSVVLTYSRGVRPGVYRFASGRLVSIERGPEPAAPARQKAAPKKKQA